MTFPEAVAIIDSCQGRGWRLDLDRMHALVKLAGLESCLGPDSPEFLHVAGTNGKGSVTATLQSLLTAQGHLAGGYFSPYVYRITERIQLGNREITEEDFALAVESLLPAASAMEKTPLEGPTEFEFKTAMGFWCWAHRRANWVALEVGLGGRLDATNIVHPRACSIVSIGWDHMAILGDTLGKIAAEKAGILKPGVPAVVGRVDPEAEASIRRVGREVGAPLHFLGQELRYQTDGISFEIEIGESSFKGLKPKLKGAKQMENAAVAVATAWLGGALHDPGLIQAGLDQTRIPGRFEQRKLGPVQIILDGAHNLDSAEVLRETLAAEGIEKVVLITNMLEGHEIEPFYRSLRDGVERVVVSPIDFYRARDPHQTAESLAQLGFHAEATTDPGDALDRGLRHAEALGIPLLVTGSFYLVGEMGRSLRRRGSSEPDATIG